MTEPENQTVTMTAVSASVRLMNGTLKTGVLRGFSPAVPVVDFEIAFTGGDRQTKTIALKIDMGKIAYVAFPSPAPSGPPPDGGLDREYDLRLVTDETLQVRCTPEALRDPRGFFVYPVARQSVHKAYYVCTHAVKRIEDKEPLGSLLVKAGVVDAASVERGLGAQAQAQNRPIGEILVEQNVLKSEDVDNAAAEQARLAKQGRPMRLGEILVEAGLASEEDIRRALDAQKGRKGKRLGEMLVELGVVKEIDVARTLARKFQLPFVDLDEEAMDEAAFSEIPRSLVEKYRVFPFKSSSGEVHVALSDPLSMEPLDMLRFSISKRIVEVMVMPSQLERYIRTYIIGDADEVSDVSMDAIMAELDKGLGATSLESTDRDFIEARIDDSAIAKLVNRIILEGYRQEASDIHIEPYGVSAHTVVRFRIDGVCVEFQKIPAANRKQVIARVKIMANLDITERRLPQDGKIRFRIGNRTVELRVATIPTVNDNEDVVLRILAGAGAMPLKSMNFGTRTLNNLDRLVNRPYGLLLAVGPTGSGKTTTLHGLVGHINDSKRKIWTAEDPVEITQYGLRQVQVKPDIGFTFAAAMRAFLRADPDVIMVGEMRDKETAAIGVEAALTGHLVLSTLHTNSAVETITRLLDMGLEPFSFSDALLGVLAQRLAQRLCLKCRESYDATAEEFDELAHFMSRERLEQRLEGKPLRLWRAPGCEHCKQKGYKGRLGIHELLVVNAEIREAIQHRATVDEIVALARSRGMQTLLEDGVAKAMDGLTDLKKVLAVCSR